jgi:hypothetical protein
MDKSDIPEWAGKRASELTRAEMRIPCKTPDVWHWPTNSGSPPLAALARYIAENEEAPVDPDLLLARSVVAAWAQDRSRRGFALRCRRGEVDQAAWVQIALATIKTIYAEEK